MNVLALCSGIGGLELGLHLAEPRSRCVCYVEREAFAVACLVRAMEAGYLASAPVWSDLPIAGSSRQADPGHGGSAMVYAHGGGPTGLEQPRPGESNANVAYATSIGRENGEAEEECQGRPAGSGAADHIWPPGPECESWQDIDPRLWPIEPRVRRVADGVPARVDQLRAIRALGNGVVPLVAAHAWRTLLARTCR